MTPKMTERGHFAAKDRRSERGPHGSLLLVAHGERGGAGTDRQVHDLVRQLQDRGRFGHVAAGFIRSQPSVAEACRDLPPGPVAVYPLFMSAGYYVATAIPREIGLGADGRDRHGRPVTVMDPVGLNPRLPALVCDLAATTAAAGEVERCAAHLLLVAHGSSKDTASREAALSNARDIADTRAFGGIETAFLDEPPFLAEALETVPGPAVVVGLFVGEGMHGGEDLPGAIAASGRDDLLLSEPLSRTSAFADLVCEDAERAAVDVGWGHARAEATERLAV
jgi:sirohydrochlorin ferrochelatase